MLWSGAKWNGICVTMYMYMCDYVNEKGLPESRKPCNCLQEYDLGACDPDGHSLDPWLTKAPRNDLELVSSPNQHYTLGFSINAGFQIKWLEFLTWAPCLCCPATCRLIIRLGEKHSRRPVSQLRGRCGGLFVKGLRSFQKVKKSIWVLGRKKIRNTWNNRGQFCF